MFGFRGFGRVAAKQEASVPVAGRQSVVLVSKEDIYRPAVGGSPSAEPVLLLKKGHAVEADELPRYIKNGAQPSQFQLRYQTETETAPHEADFQRNHTVQGATNPIKDPETANRQSRSRKRVLVLEPEQKSLKRLIDCLFLCGFNLDRIHPLRVPDHLEWSLEKYQPDILIIDYGLQYKGQSGLAMLKSLQDETGGCKIILTLPARPRLAPLEEKLVRKICAGHGIGLLEKPVNRFDMNDVLEAM